MAEYGFDLVENWETVTARRLWVMIQGLPSDAAVWRQDSWTQQEEFLAELLEMTDIASRRTVAALGGDIKKLGSPLEIPRPWGGTERQAQEEPKFETDVRKIAQFFAQTGMG